MNAADELANAAHVEVTYGEWEPDSAAAPAYSGFMYRGRIKLEPETHMWRRRRYESAVASDGRRVGRWVWERSSRPWG